MEEFVKTDDDVYFSRGEGIFNCLHIDAHKSLSNISMARYHTAFTIVVIHIFIVFFSMFDKTAVMHIQMFYELCPFHNRN
jgi:hypothetical protein